MAELYPSEWKLSDPRHAASIRNFNKIVYSRKEDWKYINKVLAPQLMRAGLLRSEATSVMDGCALGSAFLPVSASSVLC